jgi:hypothetical protein
MKVIAGLNNLRPQDSVQSVPRYSLLFSNGWSVIDSYITQWNASQFSHIKNSGRVLGRASAQKKSLADSGADRCHPVNAGHGIPNKTAGGVAFSANVYTARPDITTIVIAFKPDRDRQTYCEAAYSSDASN